MGTRNKLYKINVFIVYNLDKISFYIKNAHWFTPSLFFTKWIECSFWCWENIRKGQKNKKNKNCHLWSFSIIMKNPNQWNIHSCLTLQVLDEFSFNNVNCSNWSKWFSWKLCSPTQYLFSSWSYTGSEGGNKSEVLEESSQICRWKM